MNDPNDPGPYAAPDAPTAPSSTAVLDREEQLEDADEGDHDRFAHYVEKEKIAKAALNNSPVIALCGKVWVPGRDPGKYPVCPQCKEIYEQMGQGGGSGKGDGDGKGDSGRSGFGGLGRFFGGGR
ncbi:DUF3039 domain-containing protein [Helcobacillus massiliensis]|uniref:DUF3039 domain-containing protein n=1 Tax=Helcobacillus sp. ACRRO TaxID=2918202 RepID=UPI001EF62F9F|nr:DUF3039 domain-containing protein [Helcobacillus massiliensis]MCG7426916.1 DUF3039 domain-containing protein [Helcobacillus sp. ACRRO]MCT1557422.1 DUF3039 domain-containing protein [Helcobacillus massiliensis]MCT2036397.1 DUF3039 domain-containing protein [Helcobacillus massiliensis]MCT2331861.1 DUF3039 domain-containing protein [Helcobacillus massiliensis]MDK7742290.1 DUF3039 domain-containing protein [Helcobacillus massiliensis]